MKDIKKRLVSRIDDELEGLVDLNVQLDDILMKYSNADSGIDNLTLREFKLLRELIHDILNNPDIYLNKLQS